MKHNNSNWFITLLIFVVLLVVAFFLYNKKTETQITASETTPTSASKSPIATHYGCNGKTHCSEMTSCEEATFYQKNCPGTKMDGDRDGVPCERQWCSW